MSSNNQSHPGFDVFKRCLTKEILKRQPEGSLDEINRIVNQEWAKLPDAQKTLYKQIEEDGSMDAEMSNKTDEPVSPAESDDDDDDPVQAEQAEVTDALAKEANKLGDDKEAPKV